VATIIRGGRVLDVRAHRADAADILVTGDTISEIGAPGLPAPPDATLLDARGTLPDQRPHARPRQPRQGHG